MVPEKKVSRILINAGDDIFCMKFDCICDEESLDMALNDERFFRK